ncbi:hypothetical protein ACWERV_08515 [Streptomyces sp. NPDC004031]
MTVSAAEHPQRQPGFLVPLVAHTRWITAGCVAGTAAGLAVALPVGSRDQDWDAFNLTGQLVVLGLYLVIMPFAQFRAGARRRTAEGYAAAVPAEGLPGVRPAGEVRRRLALDAVAVGLGSALFALFGVWRLHVPFLVLLLPLLFTVFAVQTRAARGWEREHGVVLWRPALGRAGSRGKAAGLYVTPADTP